MHQKRKTKVSDAQNDRSEQSDPKPKFKRKEYEGQIAKFHAELVKLQQKAKGYEEPDYPYHFVPEKN